MDRTLQTFTLLIGLYGAVFAELPLPWEGASCDTTLTVLDGAGQKSIVSQSLVYGNYLSTKNDLAWEFTPLASLRFQPQFFLRELDFGITGEAAQELGGGLTALWKPLPYLEGETFLKPRRFRSRSGAATRLEKYEENYSAGTGMRFLGIPHSVLYTSAARVYGYNESADSLRYHNSGWSGYGAAMSRLSFPVLDSLCMTGDYGGENKDKGFRRSSFIQGHGVLLPFQGADTLTLTGKYSQGEIQDRAKGIEEESRNWNLASLFSRNFSPTALGQVFGRQSFELRNFPGHPVQNVRKNGFEGAVRLQIRKDPFLWNGLAGLGRGSEDLMPDQQFGPDSPDNSESRRNLLDNHQQNRWAEAEVTDWIRPNFRLEWHGFGQVQSTDYPYFFLSGTDTVTNRQDNDHVTVDHRLRGVYNLSLACSLSLEGRYAEYRIQYIRAAYSGGNRVQEIYSIIPSLGWKINRRIQASNDFEMLANYTTNPYSPGRNALFRQFRDKTVWLFSVSETDSLSAAFEIRLSDQGVVDSIGYYGVENKNRREEWILGWAHRAGHWIHLRPQVGRIATQARPYDFSSRSYPVNSSLSGHSWIYALHATPSGMQYFFLSGKIAYIQDSRFENYWDGNLTVRFAL